MQEVENQIYRVQKVKNQIYQVQNVKNQIYQVQNVKGQVQLQQDKGQNGKSTYEVKVLIKVTGDSSPTDGLFP